MKWLWPRHCRDVAIHEHCSETIWDRFVLADTLSILVFCFNDFRYVIAPAFSTPALSAPPIIEYKIDKHGECSYERRRPLHKPVDDDGERLLVLERTVFAFLGWLSKHQAVSLRVSYSPPPCSPPPQDSRFMCRCRAFDSDVCTRPWLVAVPSDGTVEKVTGLVGRVTDLCSHRYIRRLPTTWDGFWWSKTGAIYFYRPYLKNDWTYLYT